MERKKNMKIKKEMKNRYDKDMEKKHVRNGAQFFQWFRAMMNGIMKMIWLNSLLPRATRAKS